MFFVNRHCSFSPLHLGIFMCRPVQNCEHIEYRIWLISTVHVSFFTVDIIDLGIIRFREVTSG
jgi:hypothetical protein